MVKFFKPNKVAMILQGRHAGKKCVISETYENGTRDHPYGHCVVAGIAKYPIKILRTESARKQAKKSRVKAFIKRVNFTHITSTGYTLDIDLNNVVTGDALASRDKKATACQVVRSRFEEMFKAGKNGWFFSKHRS